MNTNSQFIIQFLHWLFLQQHWFLYLILISISRILYVLPSILNIYGLFLYALTIGVGIAQTAISVYKKSDPANCLREYFFEICENDEEESEYYRYLMQQSRIEHKNLNDLFILQTPKQILKQNLFIVLSIITTLFSLFILSVEFSYSFGYSLFQLILSSINSSDYVQIVLFVFIGFVTLIGTYVLTCFKISSC